MLIYKLIVFHLFQKMASTMKAVQVSPGGIVNIQEVPLPCPLPGEALVKVVRAGICNTDLEIIKVNYMN